MSASDLPPYALQVSPESALQFTLTRESGAESSPGCTMTLYHAGKTTEHLAFKVKTTQPRRYLVRPNQGVVAPNSSETVSILLVEKDKLSLLDAYDRLGQSALDHSKDKFLVQSCSVPGDFASKYMAEKAKTEKQMDGNNKTGKELAETLTGLWNSITSAGKAPIYNKKLQVRHTVKEGSAATRSLPSDSALADPLKPVDKPAIESMSPEQIFAEISSLRRKYDELVTFSVNLTAERDILNNALEQMKRDLNRAKAARDPLGGVSSGRKDKKRDESTGLSFSILQVLLVALLCILGGIKIAKSGAAEFLSDVPMFSSLLGDSSDGL